MNSRMGSSVIRVQSRTVDVDALQVVDSSVHLPEVDEPAAIKVRLVPSYSNTCRRSAPIGRGNPDFGVVGGRQGRKHYPSFILRQIEGADTVPREDCR